MQAQDEPHPLPCDDEVILQPILIPILPPANAITLTHCDLRAAEGKSPVLPSHDDDKDLICLPAIRSPRDGRLEHGKTGTRHAFPAPRVDDLPLNHHLLESLLQDVRSERDRPEQRDAGCGEARVGGLERLVRLAQAGDDPAALLLDVVLDQRWDAHQSLLLIDGCAAAKATAESGVDVQPPIETVAVVIPITEERPFQPREAEVVVRRIPVNAQSAAGAQPLRRSQP